MAGSLIKIDEFTISSAVASVTLGGGSSGSSGLNVSIDSTYDVYMVQLRNVAPDTNDVNLRCRLTVSGSADTSSNYDRAYKNLRGDSAFTNINYTNQTEFDLGTLGTGTQGFSNVTKYLFNFSNSSEYSYLTVEASIRNVSGYLRGFQGGGVLTVTQATDGINYFMESGNINSGTFTLYGLKK